MNSKKTYGFTWKVSGDDIMDRFAEFKAISKENAIKNYNKWILKNGLIPGKFLGEIKENNKEQR